MPATSHPFHAAVAGDFEAVDRLISTRLSSQIPLVEEIASYLIEAGGKRLRPLLVLLTTNGCGYRGDQHIKLATVIEFLHTATLLHDDVVDHSDLRRGRATVNATWGNPASVLVGDFLHSRAFEMMVEIGNMEVMAILSRATNVIAEGEVQQLSSIRNPELTEGEYMQVIHRKTAMLFEASSHSGAALAGATASQTAALKAFGTHLGMAFQLVDDALDYRGDASQLGKNIGDDLAEGKVTLPLIHALANGTESQAALIRDTVREGGVARFPEVLATIETTGAIDYTMAAARAEQDEAFACLDEIPRSSYREAMYNLAEFAVGRSF